jgi:hypothetical protein
MPLDQVIHTCDLSGAIRSSAAKRKAELSLVSNTERA